MNQKNKLIIGSLFIFSFLITGAEAQFLFPNEKTTIMYDCTYKRFFSNNNSPEKFTLITQYIPVYETKSIKIIQCINFPFLKFIEFDLENVKDSDTSFLVIINNKLHYYSFYKPAYLKLINNLKMHKISDSSFIQSIKKTNLLLVNSEDKVKKYDEPNIFPFFLSEKVDDKKYKIVFKTKNDSEETLLEKGIGFSKLKYTWERNNAYEVNIVAKR